MEAHSSASEALALYPTGGLHRWLFSYNQKTSNKVILSFGVKKWVNNIILRSKSKPLFSRFTLFWCKINNLRNMNRPATFSILITCRDAGERIKKTSMKSYIAICKLSPSVSICINKLKVFLRSRRRLILKIADFRGHDSAVIVRNSTVTASS